jgi:shikimate dehydrogenase/3-dehydroquinate dehydratase type I
LSFSAEKTVVIASFAPARNAEAEGARAVVPDGVGALEIRLDRFEEEPDLGALRAAFPGLVLVGTLRSEREGGGFSGGAAEAGALLSRALGAGFDLVDVEVRSQSGDLLGLPREKVVASFHDAVGTPAYLDALAAELLASGARHAKLVTSARDSKDAVRILRVQRAHPGLTAFGMGEAGIATRVLSPYFGAPLAYGALLPGRETAAGQVAAADLVRVYGIGTRRPVERLYALFGGLASHSLSPALHNALFVSRGEPSLYVPFAMRSLLHEFDALVAAFDGFGLPLKGASVTIPFKEEAATVAVYRGESVANTLVRSGDAFVASNTDRAAIGEFVPLAVPGTPALVLGAGGTARTAIEVLTSRRYDVHVWNREPVRAHDLVEEVGGSFVSSLDADLPRFAVLLNTTPVGMKEGDPLPCPEHLLHAGLIVIDAPYREGGTRLTRRASELGARAVDGHAILLAQAARQAELFSNRATSPAEMLAMLPAPLRARFAEGA